MVYFSEVWRHENLELKLNLGMNKPDNGVAVATFVQKVGLINSVDGLFLWRLKTKEPWLKTVSGLDKPDNGVIGGRKGS